MNSFVFIFFVIIVAGLIVQNTGSNVFQFFVGIVMCLLLEWGIIALYALTKVSKIGRQSNRIKLQHNQTLNPEADYQFQTVNPKEDYYLNKYTEQARVFKKKSAIKLTSLQQYYFQQAEINEQPRLQTMRFLQQIKGYYKILNLFNNSLVNFGKSLKILPKSVILTKFKFPILQQHYPSRIQISEIYDVEKYILQSHIKHPHSKQYFQTKREQNNPDFRKTDTRQLLQNQELQRFYHLPSWANFLKCISLIGQQFNKVQQMRNSNSQMIEMIHKRLLQDYEFIEKEIIALGKSISETRENVSKLQKQKEKYQSMSAPAEQHIDMIYWLKKQYYEFTNLEFKIKQNQSKYKQQTQKLKYYKQRLASFLNQNKKKYLKIMKTRFIAFLDSYFITVDQSLQLINKMCLKKHVYSEQKPPRVNKLPISKNINKIIEGQMRYQHQYSQRVIFHQKKLQNLWDGLVTMSNFLEQLKRVFQDLDNSLTQCLSYEDKQLQYFKRFFKTLRVQSNRILLQISQLQKINSKVQQDNASPVNHIKQNLKLNIKHAFDSLASIRISEGPAQHKYRLIRPEIQKYYRILEEQINHINQFEQLYIKHINRIKKILLVSWVNFLFFQKRCLNFGKINHKNLSDGEYDIADQMFIAEQSKDSLSVNQQVQIQQNLSLDTGNFLPPVYLNLINRFLFVAYNQWKTSQFFKDTVCNQLYVLFNLQPNQRSKQIQVYDMVLSNLPPQAVWIKQLRSQNNQFFADLNIAYKGKLSLKIKTKFKILSYMDVNITFQVQEFYCVLRLCWVSSDMGQGWFSFIGQPIAKFDIVPMISNVTIDYQSIKTAFEKIILGKMKQATYPIRQKLPIPFGKKSDDMEIIQKRFQAQNSEF